MELRDELAICLAGFGVGKTLVDVLLSVTDGVV